MPQHARFCPRYLERERGALCNGRCGAASLLLPVTLGRRCGEEAPHLQDHPGRTVAKAAEPACTGVTGGVRAFLSQSTPAPETADDHADIRGRYLCSLVRCGPWRAGPPVQQYLSR